MSGCEGDVRFDNGEKANLEMSSGQKKSRRCGGGGTKPFWSPDVIGRGPWSVQGRGAGNRSTSAPPLLLIYLFLVSKFVVHMYYSYYITIVIIWRLKWQPKRGITISYSLASDSGPYAGSTSLGQLASFVEYSSRNEVY